MTFWDLEDWMTDVGAGLLDRSSPGEKLSRKEDAMLRFWILDTEARNGGLSQYFRNHGQAEWVACMACAAALDLTTFVPFAAAVNALLAKHADPFLAIRSDGDEGEDLWFRHQPQVIRELKRLTQ
ncbi:DMP19 family protein [Roseateles chitinivorans]|uniref:DMP19 family protein n=1 Tax=Roseateles chitinivorans TaxID=2917965 RepID=UPI003D66F5B9